MDKIVIAKPLSDEPLSDDESLYQCLVELIEINKMMIQIFNVQTGITYKTYLDQTDEWFKSNIYIFQGHFTKALTILKSSLINEDKKLPYLVEENRDSLKITIIYKCDMYPFELIVNVPKFVSKHGELDDKVSVLEYQIKRLKHKVKLLETHKSSTTSDTTDEIYNLLGKLIYKGELKDGKPHGQGVRYSDYNENPLYEGHKFKDGLYDGKGILYNHPGGSQNGTQPSSYDTGEFCKGLKHGMFVSKNTLSSKNQYSIVYYHMGLMDGDCISIKDNKQMSICQYSNGVQVSKSQKDTSSENIMYDDEGNRVS